MQPPQIKGSVSQDCSPLQMQISSCHLYLWAIGLLIARLGHRPQESLHFLLPIDYKGYNSETTKCNECTGQGMWKGYIRSFHTSFIFFFFFFFKAAPVAYGSSQDRGWIKAVAASLCHSHSHTRSEPHLQTTPKFAANLTCWTRPGSNPYSQWY